jgi:hypothetical protein
MKGMATEKYVVLSKLLTQCLSNICRVMDTLIKAKLPSEWI